MLKPSLFLFPDTNLFIQCRPLNQIDWSLLGDFEEINLIVSRPVQREIDNQKNRGNDRVAQRARATYPLFRKIITGNLGYEQVNDAPPVKLIISPGSLPNQDLESVLDYNKPDDELVGCCSKYMQDNLGLDVRLLTHDAGPMMSAKSVELPFIPVPDEWLVQPEHSESERKIARLESELTRMKKAEPQFRIWCVNEDLEEVSSLSFSCKIYQPLSNEEIMCFLHILKNHFPLDMGFNSRPQTYGEIFGELKYIPPSKAAVSKYNNEEYPNWLSDCGSILLNLHKTLQEPESPYFCFLARNEENRPGNDSLVVIRARGHFKIRPPQYFDDDDKENATLRLSTPPQAPEGRLLPTSRSSLINEFSQISSPRITEELFRVPDYAEALLGNQRDPNEFDYKPDWPEVPVQSFSLECEQWRHREEPKRFEGFVFVEGDMAEVSGALEVEVHAENLSNPVKKVFPVRIEIERLSSREYAQQLIEELIAVSSSNS